MSKKRQSPVEETIDVRDEPDQAPGGDEPVEDETQSAGGQSENDGSAPSNEAAEAVQELRDEADRLAQEVAEVNEKYLRVAAELENVRRRAQTDVAEANKFAVRSFAEELVNVRDSLELAQAWEPDESVAEAVAPMKEGLQNTLKQLDQVLEKFSVAAVAPAPGDKLDPNLHQAMTAQETTDIAPNHIIDVIRKGYTIHDRLIRPAMVIVARAPSGAGAGAEQAKDA